MADTAAVVAGSTESDNVLVSDVLDAGAGNAEEEVQAACPNGTECFVAGTQIISAMNPNGTFRTEAIQNVTVGQDVLTRNANDPSGPLQEEAVTQVFVHTVYSLREVTIRDQPSGNRRR